MSDGTEKAATPTRGGTAAIGQLVAGLALGLVDLFLTLAVGMIFAGLWIVAGVGVALVATGGVVLLLVLIVVIAPAVIDAQARKAAAEQRRPGGG